MFDNSCPIAAAQELRGLASEGAVIEHAYEIGMADQKYDQVFADYCRESGLAFVTQDKSIRTSYRAVAFARRKVGFVQANIPSGTGLERLQVYRDHYPQLLDLIGKPNPFCYSLSRNGFHKKEVLGRLERRGQIANGKAWPRR